MRRREGRALAPGDRGRPLDLQRVRHRGRRRIVDHQDADPERDRHLEAAPSPHRHISGLNQQRRPASEPTDLEHPIGQQVGDPQRHLDRSNAQSHDGSRARDGTARDTEQGAFPATRYAPRGKSPAKPPTGSIRRGRISLRKPSRSATRPPPTSSASDEIATDGWAETSPPKPDPAGESGTRTRSAQHAEMLIERATKAHGQRRRATARSSGTGGPARGRVRDGDTAAREPSA